MGQAVARRRMLLIHNPTAGLLQGRLRRAVAALTDRNIEVRVLRTSGPRDAWRLAREAPADLTAILIAGGDGTFNEAVNGLMERPPPRPPLGLLPSGTANVLARELGLPLQADRAAGLMADAMAQTMYLGRVNGRYFATMAGVGLDARVVAHLPRVLKRGLGRAGYTIETLRQMFLDPPPSMTVTVDGVAYRAHSVVAAKARYYGGSIQVAPSARAVKPGLALCVFQGQGTWTTFGQTAAALLGCHLRRPDVTLLPATTIRLDEPSGAPVQADGELVGRLPARIDASSEEIQVLVPVSAPQPTAKVESGPATCHR